MRSVPVLHIRFRVFLGNLTLFFLLISSNLSMMFQATYTNTAEAVAERAVAHSNI